MKFSDVPLVEGTGANRVLLVFSGRKEQAHFMVDRLMKRGGWERGAFLISSLEHPNLNGLIKQHGIKCVVGLGEQVLHHLLGEVDVMRWRGRFTQHPMGVWQMVTFEPSMLLAYKAEDVEEGKAVLRHPPRFQGLWAMDIARAIYVAKEGYVRKKPYYICDPKP